MSTIDRLILDQQPYLKALARNIAKTLPHHVEYDELVGFGQIGLAEAARAFDPQRGVSFTTFAHYRVRGAIFDGLRKMTWLPPAARRTVVEQSAADEVVQSTLEPSNKQPATPSNRTTAPGQTPSTASAPRQPTATTESGHREAAAKQFADAVARLGAVFAASSLRQDETTTEPTDERQTGTPTVESAELKLRVRAALESLPDDQRSLIRILYIEGKSMAQVGAILGKNKSTICRRHAEAIDSLRAALRDADAPATPLSTLARNQPPATRPNPNPNIKPNIKPDPKPQARATRPARREIT